LLLPYRKIIPFIAAIGSVNKFPMKSENEINRFTNVAIIL